MMFHFRRVSTNRKLGPMPAVMASQATCPSTCALRGAGCYAEHGPASIFWRKLTAGDAPNQVTFEQLLHLIRALPKRIRWRYGTAGDLPPEPADVVALARANGGREAIVFTHGRRYDTYRKAGALGMHINVSTDSLAEADAVLDAAPDMSVVTVLPSDHGRRPTHTPSGREVAVCPATFSDRVTCSTCNLCSRPRPRGVIVGFPAHGSRRRMIDRRLTDA
ncbi:MULTISPECIES: hypothetical protein [Methylobacterium]|jgi:hypothetical protein|uniref:DUF7227 domain-containing protein n=2 Tax=Pseudomonadota TaxID=1224 RepID=A0ABQ4SZ51_9HYPH|nr:MULTISPECIES: hypothetical protein [Methylobacterium]PIU05259.1 MAG: hypothetical protein COT56_15840 [Methylobacterium sp. CG09_land_8_20_14_0_10_71_15]PIU12002.1 MAG: hypothetical protein COT28_17175 [Methylobacterium sp. CG08_land_8_20_14_0_20_71_15]GBU16822.1 hypothetical protein AwMethylo_10370 [Methylobacterium sp.]GJE08367.1 hypothetical protein AOPFMNJM_3704 [Methylobacterium jeotgali]